MFKNWRPFLFGLCTGLLSVAIILILSKRQTGVPIKLAPRASTPTPLPLRVHVTGAVNAPGVYELTASSIVQDALAAAGGLTDTASTDRLNLAELITDGQQIFLPSQSQPAISPPDATGGPAQSATGQPAAAPGQIVNINTGTQAELETLPRIGPVIAQRIIDYRTTNGRFTSIDQIENVTGIGDATFEAIKDYITVK